MTEVEVVTKAVQQIYGPGGGLEDWAAHEAVRDPNLAGRYASLLISEGVLPSTDKANGFVFFSPSANQGVFEFTIAKQFDASLSGGYEKPPQFIIADIFGQKGKDGKFEPGFKQNLYDPSTLDIVKFQRLSADANHMPLQDGSVDVLWDRLGALWYAQSARGLHPSVRKSKKAVADLLKEYRRVIKPNGVLVVDADPNKPAGAVASTMNMLYVPKENKGLKNYKLDITKYGWKIRHIGVGEERLAILTPTEEKPNRVKSVVRSIGKVFRLGKRKP